MSTEVRAQLRQRADYTHKFNSKTGRHGWLRLTPAYSVKVVEELIERYPAAKSVFDPFCGTGTTALSAVNHGHAAATTDINPFLVWLARAKTAHYTATTLAKTERLGREALSLAARAAVAPIPEPPIHNIERWWSGVSRRFLCQLKACIEHVAGESGAVADLLNIAFCRTLIQLSNASFNHQSMSFKNEDQHELELRADPASVFWDDLKFVLQGAADNPSGKAEVIQTDARQLDRAVTRRFDVLITSPPYANRMSYIRELRPYMYWLGFLQNGRDAGELDWLAIGGTWGVATSRLAEWNGHKEIWMPDTLQSVVAEIAHGDNKNGALLSTYVSKYCSDMSLHFSTLGSILKPGASVHYIVGNSTFYGVLVPTEEVYAAMLRHYGFKDVAVRAIRKRNSKKELVEFDVAGTWPGPVKGKSKLRRSSQEGARETKPSRSDTRSRRVAKTTVNC